jgi:hypothetical protein
MSESGKEIVAGAQKRISALENELLQKSLL